MMALRGLVPWFIGLVALGWIGAANGQTFPVTAGEHPDFTRVVVHAPPGTSWSLTKVAENHLLSVAPSTAGFDLTRLFDRIPRTRLAGARSEPGLLTLNIPCNCGTNAWEERPGLIVIDITNRIEPTQVQPPPSPVAVAAVDPARAAGIALAQAHALEQMQMDTPPEEPPLPSLDALTETLGRPIAQALGQGLLEPATSRGGAPPVLLRPGADAPVDLPENMRIATATDRPDPSAPPASVPRDTCVGAEALDFLLAPATGDFGTTFGRLTRELYGEFDQPRRDIRRALIQHYLSSGFGAEARALIENDSDPVSGRESLLGMSDLLEDRNSNSRLRLAQMIGCTGPTSLLAALAGAPDADIRQSASDIALTFTELDPPLRSILGQDLTRRLIEVGATDAARIVIGSTRRSPWSNALELDILEAQLERALGHPADAIARLAHLQGASAQSLQAQLDLALETGSPVSAALLSEAEALASAHRNAAAGPDLMDAIIRLHARDRSFQIGFDALDRLRAWFPENSGAQSRISDLRDDLWGAIAKEGDDLALMHTILNRADWLDPDLGLATRQALAQRLLDLGLARQAIDLLPEEGNARNSELLGRAYLLSGQPDRVLSLLAGAATETGRHLRAQALVALGETGLAAQEFAALDNTAEARSAAILAQDWARLQQLDGPSGQDPGAAIDAIGHAISRRPGYLNTAPPGSPVAASGAAVAPVSPGADAPQPTAIGPPAGRLRNGGTDAAPDTRTGAQTGSDASAIAADALLQPAQGLPATRADPDPAFQSQSATAQAGQTSSPPEPDIMDPGPGTPIPPDPAAYDFDRLGLITRSATLLGESELLRETLAPLLLAPIGPAP